LQSGAIRPASRLITGDESASHLVTGEQPGEGPRWLLIVAAGAVALATVVGTVAVLLWLRSSASRRA